MASPSLDRTLATVSAEVRPGQVALYGGEKESLLMNRKMAAIVARFPHSEEILRLDSHFKSLLNLQRGDFAAGAVFDLGDKAGSNLPGNQAYAQFKDYWTTHGGITTAQADIAVDALPLVPVTSAGPAVFRAVLGGGW